MKIRLAESAEDIDQVRELFREYAASLGAEILCFQGFEAELAKLPGAYAAPRGCLLIAEHADQTAGCVGVRPLDKGLSDRDACELKRLFVRRQFRGAGLGRLLVETALARARQMGYSVMRLDTLASMAAAQQLYESLGFHDIPALDVTAPCGTRDMEMRLG